MMRPLMALPRLLTPLIVLLSLTVTICIRDRPGLRTYSIGQLAALALAALMLPHLLAFAQSVAIYFFPILMLVQLPSIDIDVGLPFTLYLLALPIIAWWQRSREFARLCQRDAVVSYCRGISRLEFLARRFPRITLSQVYVYIEPTTVFVAGLLTYWLISTALGIWWMAAALAIAIREQANAMAELDTVLDESEIAPCCVT